jgi:hypothetical protein
LTVCPALMGAAAQGRPACLTVKVWPAMLITLARELGLKLAATSITRIDVVRIGRD